MYREPALMLLAAVLASLLTWYVLAGRHDAAIANLTLQHQKRATRVAELHVLALQKANAKFDLMQKEKDHALERASIRAATNANALAAARVELDGLRHDLSDARARIASAPVAALREYANTVSDLYGECEAELTETAAAATGHASDVQMILDAFPKEGN